MVEHFEFDESCWNFSRHVFLILTLTIVLSYTYPETLTYGKWTDALRFPESYENGIKPDGKKYFACQGKNVPAFDVLKDWWQHRCFDDIREEPRKPRVCNSTPTCCYKLCVLQRLEWLSTDLKYNKPKAHAYIKGEYGDKNYPKEIIEDFIDEFDYCADWYEERDTLDCAKNSAFVKCQTQVFINVCDRLPTSLNSISLPPSNSETVPGPEISAHHPSSEIHGMPTISPASAPAPAQTPTPASTTTPTTTTTTTTTSKSTSTPATTVVVEQTSPVPVPVPTPAHAVQKTPPRTPESHDQDRGNHGHGSNNSGPGHDHGQGRELQSSASASTPSIKPAEKPSHAPAAHHRSIPNPPTGKQGHAITGPGTAPGPSTCVDKCKNLCLAHTKF